MSSTLREPTEFYPTPPDDDHAGSKAIHVENLWKRYDSVEAVRGISLDVDAGEIFGLIGPDGAGKTTTFQILAGVMNASSGDVTVFGEPAREMRSTTGYLTQAFSLYPDLTVEENILLVLETLPLTKQERDHQLEVLLDELDIAYVRHTKAYQLSGGERRRTEIARCLVIEPRFILLDEPFAGIDPIAVIDIQGILQKLKERGIGVLITDHNVRETLAITDRAYIINDGRIFRAGTPDTLTRDEEVRRVYLGENFRM